MKKCVSIILVLIMLLSCSATVFADASVDDFSWNYTPASSAVKSTAQLYVGLASDSEFRDYLFLEPDSFSNGFKFSTSKSPSDALEDNYDYFSFPSFFTLSLNRGGQFGLDTSKAKAGDIDYITYFENGVLYKLKVNIKYGPNSPYKYLNPPDEEVGGQNGPKDPEQLPFSNFVPDKAEVKKTAQLYMRLGGGYMYSDFNVHFEEKDQKYFGRFFTSKSEDSEVPANIDRFAFPYFLDVVNENGLLAFKVNDNAHYGNYGHITYFEDGTLYKMEINVYANKGAIPEPQKAALAAKGRAESAAIIAAGKEYDLTGQTVAETKQAESAADFKDVLKSDYYYDSVDWAVKNQITTGTSNTTFSPKATCTRGQVVTFLWRMYGQPQVDGANKFKDVKASDYYAQAVAWAVSKGITLGTSETTFSPGTPCTNAQIICFIQRANGSLVSETGSTWYDGAVNWAKENNMLEGTYSGTFDVAGACPRCNVVEYLYRLANIK